MDTKAKVLFALWLTILINYLDRVAMSFAGPAIMKSMHMSPAAFGIILSSFGVGYTLAQIPGGLMADRWGAKPLLIIGPFLWAACTGATGLVATVAGFVVVRCLLGVSEGVSAGSGFKTVGDLFTSKQRAGAVAIWHTAMPLGPAVAGTLVGRLVSDYGWQVMFFAMALPPVLLAGLNALLIPGRRPAPRDLAAKVGEIPFRAVFRQPSMWLICVGQFAWDMVNWGYVGWMPSYLAMERHIHLKALGALSSIPYAFGFIGLLVGGWLGTAFPRHRLHLTAASYLLGGLSLFLAYRALTIPLCLAGLSGTSFFLLGASGPKLAVVLELAPPRYRAAYSSLQTTAGQIGGTIAPAVIGFMVTSTGSFAAGFVFMSISLCAAAACMLALIPLMALKPRPEIATA